MDSSLLHCSGGKKGDWRMSLESSLSHEGKSSTVTETAGFNWMFHRKLDSSLASGEHYGVFSPLDLDGQLVKKNRVEVLLPTSWTRTAEIARDRHCCWSSWKRNEWNLPVPAWGQVKHQLLLIYTSNQFTSDRTRQSFDSTTLSKDETQPSLTKIVTVCLSHIILVEYYSFSHSSTEFWLEGARFLFVCFLPLLLIPGLY